MNGMHIGLIGCGNWGQYILRDLKKLGCRVSVVVLSEENRARALQLGADEVLSQISALSGVNGVVVATPTSTHLAVVQEVAKCVSVPIFVEKPLSNDAKGAEIIVQAIGERLFVMDKWRYHPGVLALAKIAREKILGSVLGVRSYRLGWGNPHLDVDGVWILAPHDLSIILEILGFLPEPRAATATHWQNEITGLTAVLGDYPWATFEVSARDCPTRREVRLECEEGVAVLSDGYAEHIAIYRNDDSWRINVEPKVEYIKIGNELPLYAELACFINYLQGGPSPKSNAKDALAIVQMIAALRRMAGWNESERYLKIDSGASAIHNSAKEDCQGIN